MKGLLLILILALWGCSDKGTNNTGGNGGSSVGLVAYWAMNEIAGDTAMDMSGFGNHVGNENVSPTWVQDPRIGSSVDLSGNGSYLETADADLSINFPGKEGAITGSMSITAWVYPEANRYMMIAAKDQANARSFNFSITGQQKIGVQIYANVNDVDIMTLYSGLKDVTQNTWNHLAMTYTYDSDTSSIVVAYLNGVADTTYLDAVGPIQPTATSFRLGGRTYAGQLASFNGQLDEVRIYNRTLSAAEILSMATVQ